ncbi:hypothetical protein AncyloWKF20_08655 [Ancylobacter sp. WKF20]|uniref:hypothetical protein n=1 Tax=Ancylobacter sp. WKF20 TaxID=3039801 RepID=UPI0024342989|nr:hypothetical protein [Ancylobacter sp. WKF20]WGD31873.1 hypothetical protein AncyloWKF20_08655 [Ancylobacter sp. WKF20]
MNAHTREFVMVERLALRERVERAIESLIFMLDQLDGDPDIEADDFPEADDPAEDDDPAEMDDFREDDDPAEDDDPPGFHGHD